MLAASPRQHAEAALQQLRVAAAGGGPEEAAAAALNLGFLWSTKFSPGGFSLWQAGTLEKNEFGGAA